MRKRYIQSFAADDFNTENAFMLKSVRRREFNSIHL